MFWEMLPLILNPSLQQPLDEEIPMPFHPTCFEIFTRASRLRSHHINIHGLAGWRRLESSYHAEKDFPRYSAVKYCMDQWWIHEPGSEWLAANPVHVPLLPTLLNSATDRYRTYLEEARLSFNDPFKKLPLEITYAILDLLSPTDIASLRLAWCATHLPISHWRQLLLEEMPWLGEIWDDVPPSTWATFSVSALAAKQEEYEDMEALLKERHAIIKKEMPEILDLWSRDHVYTVERIYTRKFDWSEIGRPKTPFPRPTNWCRLYYLIRTRWDDLKGLQNRQRIWTDMQEILNRIARYREEGSIV